jgi:membrane-associated protein
VSIPETGSAASGSQAQESEAPEGQAPEGEAPEGQEAKAPEAKNPWDDPRMPWQGKPGKADVLCLLGIIVSGVYYYALLPFRASLLGTHPVWSVLLNGSTESIISAAAFARVGHGTIAVVVLAAIPGLMKFDLLYWWAGRLWGERYILLVSGKSKRSLRYIERAKRSGRKFTWPAMILSPFIPFGVIIYIIAGWTGMRWVTFLILDLIGNLIWTGLLVGLGYALGQHAVNVAKEISHYGLYVTIALIVVVVFIQIRSQRRMFADTAAAAREAAEVVEDDLRN